MRSIYSVVLLLVLAACKSTPSETPTTRPLDINSFTIGMPADTIRLREGFDDINKFTTTVGGAVGEAELRFAVGKLMGLTWTQNQVKSGEADSVRSYLTNRFGPANSTEAGTADTSSTAEADQVLIWNRAGSTLYASLAPDFLYVTLDRSSKPAKP